MAAVATDTRLSCVCCTMHIGADHTDRCVLPCGHLYCLARIGTRSRFGLHDRTSCIALDVRQFAAEKESDDARAIPQQSEVA